MQARRPARTSYSRSDIISKLSYRKMKKNLLFQYWGHFLLLMVITVGITGAFYVYLTDQHEKREILLLATKGLSALENEETTTAQTYFDQALERFLPYHPNPSENRWNADAKLYSVLFKVAEGYRSVGNYVKAIDTLEALAKRNIHQRQRWMAEQLQYHLNDVIMSARWNGETINQLYHNLLNRLPSSWGPSAYYQTWATELAGLRVVPMPDRYREADLVVYGIPKHFDQLQQILIIEGIRYYKVDQLPGEITIHLPPELMDTYQKRIAWYVEAGYECLIFGKTVVGGFQLLGIEGIVLSDHHTVEPFNALVIEHES
jgi:tetratricopeptide (TPR) repeat protein